MAKNGSKVSAPKVPSPKSPSMSTRLPGSRLFPHVIPPRLKPLKTRIYAKNVTAQDPSQFAGNAGFGNTGETGES